MLRFISSIPQIEAWSIPSTVSCQPGEARQEIHPGYPFHISRVRIAEFLDAVLVGFESVYVDQPHRSQAQDHAGPMLRDQHDAQVDQ